MRKRLVVLFILIAMVISTTSQAIAQNRLERVDLLVLGGTIVTMDASRSVIDDGAIAVRDGRIIGIGPRAEIERRYTAPKKISGAGKLIDPVSSIPTRTRRW
jgi:hypothetical protein